MYKRFISIIEDLTERENHTLDSFVEKYAVSKQTIRNDIHNINQFLTSYGLSEIAIKDGNVYRGDNLIYSKGIINDLIKDNLYSYKFSKEELVILSSLALIYEEEYVTIDELSERFLVSRTTFINSLTAIKEYLKLLGLHVISASNKGIKLTDHELARREALVIMLRRCIKENRFLLVVILKNSIFFQEDYRPAIKKILNHIKQKHKIELTDFSYRLIEYYLSYSIKKLAEKKYVEEITDDMDSEQYVIATDIMKHLSEEFHLTVPETEIHFVSNLYYSVLSYKSPNINYKQSLQIQFLTRKLITAVSDALSLDLNTDFSLFEKLSNHLITLFSQQPLDDRPNQILNDIKASNEDIIEKVTENISIIESYYLRNLTESELLLIAVHFCAAVEKKKIESCVYDAVLVSNASAGIIELICAKLKVLTNLRVVRVINSHEILDDAVFCEDLLIVTEPIIDNSIRTVKISNLVTNQDLQKIAGVILELIRNNILPMSQQKNKEEMMIGSPEKVALRSLSLGDLCTPQLISLDISCSSWEEAVCISTKQLEENGYVVDSYADAIIEMTKEYGPYYIIAPKIAIAHANPQNHCIKPGIGFIRLKEPVLFGEQQAAEVKYLFTLSAVDKQLHLNGLFQLHNLLLKENCTDILEHAKTAEELHSYFKNIKRD